jgi:hypothetical protein
VNSSHPVSRLLSELLGRRVGRHFRSRHLPPIDVASPPLATQRDGTLVLLWSAGCSKSAPTLCWDLNPVQRFTCKSQQNEEPTSGLEPLTCSLRVITQALQGCAEDCKYPLSKGIPLLCLAEGCTVLRSRWYQSGINRGIAPSQCCSLGHASEVRSAPRWARQHKAHS